MLIDVRLANKYEGGHSATAQSIPLYLPIQGWGLPSIIRRAGFAFFGIFGTELNTEFAADVQARVPKGEQCMQSRPPRALAANCGRHDGALAAPARAPMLPTALLPAALCLCMRAGKTVLLICESSSGSLTNKSGTKYGFQSRCGGCSTTRRPCARLGRCQQRPHTTLPVVAPTQTTIRRSLKAAYFLQQAGYKNVAYVTGGLPAWARAQLPMADGPEGADAGADDDDDSDDGGLRVGALRLPQLSGVFAR